MLTHSIILLSSCLCLPLAMASRGAGCQGYQDCSLEREENCYKNMCLTAKEIMALAFDIGKPSMII